MKIFLAIFLLVAIAGAAEYWALRQRAAGLCHSARALARHAPALSALLREAEADPFLGEAALRGPPNGLTALYRDRARSISAELSARFLPAPATDALRRLALARGEGPELAAALDGLAPAAAGIDCRGTAPAAEADDLAKRIDTAQLFWAERRAVSKIERQEFARDQLIFCHGEDLLKKLRGVVLAADEACRAAKPGSKLARSCGGASREAAGTGSVEEEIRDLEKQKELNLRKLRQKWPVAVVAGLAC
jgi:hypothetical protein